MKGIILVGGSGKRLYPLTLCANKHLLPVWNKPMVYYPIRSLVESGVRDILLVCGGNAPGDFLRIIGNGEHFGLKHVAYTYQKEASGIAHALSLAEEWAYGEPICVILGDNILEKPFKKDVDEFRKNPEGAKVFLTKVKNPEWYGIAELSRDDNVINIVEKPKEPKTNWAVIGLYMYDHTVWEYIRSLKPSKRNELEITDLNNSYLKRGKLRAAKVRGYWGDAGESIDTYLDTCIKVRSLRM